MKRAALTLLLILVLAGIAFAWLQLTQKSKRFSALHLPAKETAYTYSPVAMEKLRARSREAKSFAEKNSYNDAYCFLIDMKQPSGKNRFFIYDLQHDSISAAGLVTHGRCNEDWLDGRRYSNTVGGGCTSLGKYRIGQAYHGRFGLAFKLHGLEKQMTMPSDGLSCCTRMNVFQKMKWKTRSARVMVVLLLPPIF